MVFFVPPIKPRPKRVKTPTVLQMEAVECGAAALGKVLGYHGKIVPLAKLRQVCGVSRDGVTAASVLKAARSYGMEAKGFKKSLERALELEPPFIVFWHFNHFVVVEGQDARWIYLNDPAAGPRRVTAAEFDEGYTGIALTFVPGPEFQKGGRRPSMVRSLWQRLHRSWGILFLALIAGLFLVLPALVLPALSRIFVDSVLLEGQFEWLPYLLVGLLLTAVVQGWLTALQLRYLRSLQIKLAVGSTSRFVWHVLRLPVGFYAQRFAGEIASRIRLNDEVATVLSGRLISTVISLALVLFYALAMAQYDLLLTAIAVGFAAINVVTLQWIARERVNANLRLSQETGKAAGVAIAGLQTMETLKASGLESDFFARWAGYYAKSINAQQDLGLTNQILGILPSLLSALTSLALLVVGGWRVINGDLTIGMLVAFQLLMVSFQRPVNALVRFASTLQTLQGNLTRLDDVLGNSVDQQLLNDEGMRGWGNKEDRRQKDSDFLTPSSPSSSPSPLPHRLTGSITLHDLAFGYHPLEPPLIEGLNLSIQPGQRVALVGGSGSGKSTVAKVMAGLYEPRSGKICFDDVCRSQIPRAVLTNSIAVVEQDILIFEGTIRDNLTLWDTTIPEVDLRRAAQDAAIADVILALPYGFSASLLEGAANLSGGQRQRLEIARALVSNPSILILDEATSALDTETEQIIDQNLRRRGCTCVIVAHRLSTIRDCDEILVFERGKVVQRGTHESLWQEEGLYRKLIQSEGE
ncbi:MULTISPECIES: NHLP family bacteriocin export ABC transporter peptidase/permease/ATPase subunit [Cyanophyceae]|uniref:NHLP family bacteriocin export ABC transporter peptidase/permease/ATPase subunit n=1 Tax=Cyanophyceae TaxID=3028117 RepID=UPI0016822AD5|nr:MULTISPECIES: NHLP family bacteriocin export ABC transporter peptidase/permease/ATPase subunit [Cyanophyceae]MBD1919040.1 NHLP family bacteriocin export ABC transporter peptidase/permease/ATPase subunit [Phormidium sp. FACHB-77]MBD2028967.1 NHLP family bacteriocin export ABC transporter peptidase/permease/ATPase subunit [Phormidium sp. FACHB-322]MBD2053974.1 NHLP family bacteriocin export ABC transporter peptidase/permease/ATPase subunit [Leptolyngbya sp. FACHB-60]